MIGTARPDERETFEVRGHTLQEIKEQVLAQTPTGWSIVSAPVKMHKGSTLLTATATIERQGGFIEVEAEDLGGIRAKLPAGHKLLFVQRAR